MEVTDAEISIVSKGVAAKAACPIDVTEQGMLKDSSDEQPTNDCPPIDVTPSAIVIFLIEAT